MLSTMFKENLKLYKGLKIVMPLLCIYVWILAKWKEL